MLLIIATFGGAGEVSWLENFAGKNLTFVQRGLTIGSDFLGNIFSPAFNVWRLDKINQSLELENAQLRRQLIEATLTEKKLNDLKRLESALNYVDENAYEPITCDVVAKDPGTWFSMFVINKGTADGVYPEQAVIDGNGLVGLVYETGKDWAKVVSIIDNKSSVSFKVLDDTEELVGIVEGGVERNMEGYLFDPKAEVAVGQSIITSGLGIYPEGLFIGTVTNVVIEKNELLKRVEVAPGVDFKRMDRVMVLAPRTGGLRP